MGYQHIENLYKNQDILQFKECYAMEKIHGTSAHISWKSGRLSFFAGGGNHESFVGLFNQEFLSRKFTEFFGGNSTSCRVYGESYGGKQQGMSGTYGKEPKFICFEVKIGDKWLNVPKAEEFVKSLNFEFVHYVLIPVTMESLDKQLYEPSVQAKRNGIMENKKREGIVLHPLEEFTKNNGERIICKHKHPDFRETKTQRKVSADELTVIADAKAIASEWVTRERLNHILTSGKVKPILANTGNIINLMLEDIIREAEGEVILSKQTIKETNRATALLFKQWLREQLEEVK